MPEIYDYQAIGNLTEFIGQCEIAGAVKIVCEEQADGTWTVTVT